MLCPECWQTIHLISRPYCEICGIPQEFELEKNIICNSCKHDPPHYDKARAVCSYGDSVIKMVSNFKYNSAFNVGDFMASRINSLLSQVILDCDVIVPVPIHKYRLIKRGFNQAAEIAKIIAKKHDKPLLLDSLKKISFNVQQTRLNKQQRIENVKDSFAIPSENLKDFKDKKVLLIDDVLTTGATVNECSRIIKLAKAKQVEVAVFARTGLDWRKT